MRIYRLKQKVTWKMRRLFKDAGLRKKKIFAIGFNKTGTSSLHNLFESFGLLSYHGIRWRDCDDLRFLGSFDCFSDGIPKDLAKLDRLFPDSKFILQVRELDCWVYSRLADIDQNKEKNNHAEYSRMNNTERDIKAWIQKRNDYHLFVLTYFAERPADLLIVNFIRDESAAIKVANFLGYKGRLHKPESSVNPQKFIPANYTEMLRNSIAELGIPESELNYDIYCPSLESDEARKRFPADSSQL